LGERNDIPWVEDETQKLSRVWMGLLDGNKQDGMFCVWMLFGGWVEERKQRQRGERGKSEAGAWRAREVK
jgi:hypothetical protein